MARVIRVLVIDDSSLVRNILAQGLSMDSGIEVVGTAPDPLVAQERIARLKPDVITLDVKMPRMDGVEFLKLLMAENPIPVVMVSAYTSAGQKVALDALEAGAVDFVTKPSTDVAAVKELEEMLGELRIKIRAASRANVSRWKSWKEKTVSPGTENIIKTRVSGGVGRGKIIAIGASTGGTEAIKKIIRDFPIETPGIVIVQHMPAGFTKNFAERLNSVSVMDVKEAVSDESILPGKILVAPGNFHMEVIRSPDGYKVVCEKTEKVKGHRPSVDVLMRSVAKCAGIRAVGVILTGMGSDGACGALAMKSAGARVIAQDKASSLVFGMPHAALKEGAVERLVPLEQISRSIMTFLNGIK